MKNSLKPKNLSGKNSSNKRVLLKSDNINPKEIKTNVIPVKTGIRSTIVVDSRFRGNDKGVSGNDKSVGAWNFKHWHKVSAAVLSLGIIAVVVFFQFAPQRMS